MFCPECGAQQPEEDAKFCLKCGAPLITQATPPHAADVQETAPAQASAQPDPEAAPSAPRAVSPKLIAIIVGAVAAIVAVVALLVVPQCTQSGGTPQPPDQAQEPAPDNTDGGTTSVRPDYEVFVGSWVANDSNAENMPQEWFASAAEQGVYFVLTLNDDFTGTFQTDHGVLDFTWMSSSAATASLTLSSNGNVMNLTTKTGRDLTMINGDGTEMYFVPAESVDMSNAIDPTDPQANPQTDPQQSDPQQTEASAGMQRIGNEAVGFLQVPSAWVDRVQDLDPKVAAATQAVYFADPESEYLSGAQSHFAFAKSIQMSVESASYLSVSSRIAATYQGDDYGETTDESFTVGGRNGVLLVSSIPKDNVNVATIVIDRDGDDKTTVVLTLNCGSMDDVEAATEVLSYAAKWTVS